MTHRAVVFVELSAALVRIRPDPHRWRLQHWGLLQVQRRSARGATQLEHVHASVEVVAFRRGGEALDQEERSAVAAGHGDVLLTANLVADRTGQRRGLVVRGPQRRAGPGIQRQELTVAGALEHKPAGGGKCPAVPRTPSVRPPHLALRQRVPGDQHACRGALDGGSHGGIVGKRLEGDSGILESGPRDRLGLVGVTEGILLSRQIDEACLRAERHRVPVVSARRAGADQRGGPAVASFGILHRPARLRVDGVRPADRQSSRCVLRRRHGQKWSGGNQLAAFTIHDIEEAVLRRLQRDLPRLAVDRELGKHDRLRRCVVPGLPRCVLVVPLVRAGGGIERDDGGQKQVVAAAGRSDLLVPRRAVAHADDQLIEVRVVDDGVPHGATTAKRPPLAVPRGGRSGHDGI